MSGIITIGIGPSETIIHFLTTGLDIGAVVVPTVISIVTISISDRTVGSMSVGESSQLTINVEN